ncbi:hypothetical protein ACHQM5_002988 [Ranunculus cassubicifolius]
MGGANPTTRSSSPFFYIFSKENRAAKPNRCSLSMNHERGFLIISSSAVNFCAHSYSYRYTTSKTRLE